MSQFSILLISIICLLIVWAKVINFKLLKVECINHNDVQNISCAIRNYDNGDTSCDIDIEIFRPVYDVLIHIEVWKKLNGVFILTPVNMTVNACRYSSRGEKVPFHANLIMKWVKQYSNLNLSCPFQGHVYVRNLKVNNFRVIIPEGEYRMDMKLFEKSFSNPLITVRGYGKKM